MQGVNGGCGPGDIATPTSASFVGTGFGLSTTNLDRHFATGGAEAGDVADLADSAGNDVFTDMTNIGTGDLLHAPWFDFVGIRGGTNTRLITHPLVFTQQQFGTWV